MGEIPFPNMQCFSIMIYNNSMKKSFWHFNLDFKNGTRISTAYLCICLSGQFN